MDFCKFDIKLLNLVYGLLNWKIYPKIYFTRFLIPSFSLCHHNQSWIKYDKRYRKSEPTWLIHITFFQQSFRRVSSVHFQALIMKNKSQILQYKIRSYINDIPMEGREAVRLIVDGLWWVRRGVNATETSISNNFSSAILIHMQFSF